MLFLLSKYHKDTEPLLTYQGVQITYFTSTTSPARLIPRKSILSSISITVQAYAKALPGPNLPRPWSQVLHLKHQL